jgi:hypothetical protein
MFQRNLMLPYSEQRTLITIVIEAAVPPKYSHIPIKLQCISTQEAANLNIQHCKNFIFNARHLLNLETALTLMPDSMSVMW